jgi:hypothetical protein
MNLNLTNRHIVKMEGGAELHTRKGWRGSARPRGTNRRRKLFGDGLNAAPLSRTNRLRQAAQAPQWFWSKLKGRYNVWLSERIAARLKAQEAARIAAEQARAEQAAT